MKKTKKYAVNQPDGTPAQVVAKNKSEAYEKLCGWLGNKFEFSIKDVYLIRNPKTV